MKQTLRERRLARDVERRERERKRERQEAAERERRAAEADRHMALGFHALPATMARALATHAEIRRLEAIADRLDDEVALLLEATLQRLKPRAAPARDVAP